MTNVLQIYETLCAWAPLSLQMDYDNSGFQIGHAGDSVKCVLLALDVTDAVVEEAIAMDADLIISHHPILFHATKAITDENPAMKRILRLAENRIAVISMHTNLDIAEGGVNDTLIRLLGALPEESLDISGCGRIGSLKEPCRLEEFLILCKDRLQTKALRFYDSGKPVFRLAVMGGAGGSSIEDAWKKGCDTYVTSDLKYHQFLLAEDLGLNLIDGDHFCTENPIMFHLHDRLSAAFPDVRFVTSMRHLQIVRFF